MSVDRSGNKRSPEVLRRDGQGVRMRPLFSSMSCTFKRRLLEMTIGFISLERSCFSYFVTACRAMVEETGRFEPSARGWLTWAQPAHIRSEPAGPKFAPQPNQPINVVVNALSGLSRTRYGVVLYCVRAGPVNLVMEEHQKPTTGNNHSICSLPWLLIPRFLRPFCVFRFDYSDLSETPFSYE